MNRKDFYEGYWRKNGAPPQDDPTIGERKACLEAALRKFSGTAPLQCIQVLDAGCGDGEFVVFLRDLGFRLTGIELSEAAAMKARERCPEAHIGVGSLEEALPFGNGAFDVIWCTEVLEHLFDVHGVLVEFNRVLKDGGILLLTTPYHGMVKNLAIALWSFEQHFNPDISHIRFFARRTLERCLRRTAFTPVVWQGIGRMWPLWKSFFVVARKKGPPGPPPEIIG